VCWGQPAADGGAGGGRGEGARDGVGSRFIHVHKQELPVPFEVIPGRGWLSGVIFHSLIDISFVYYIRQS
jgi:hypothetical protein